MHLITEGIYSDFFNIYINNDNVIVEKDAKYLHYDLHWRDEIYIWQYDGRSLKSNEQYLYVDNNGNLRLSKEFKETYIVDIYYHDDNLNIYKSLYENDVANFKQLYKITPYEILIEISVRIESGDNFEYIEYLVTPLIYAIIKDNFDIVRYIIDSGYKNINFKSEYGSALYISLKHRNDKISKYLLDNGAKLTTEFI